MFIGEFNQKIDAKGRVMIPAKLRELLGEKFVLARGFDGCLSVYPVDEWETFEKKLAELPIANKDARWLSRYFTAGASVCVPDGQGRILVAPPLREFAGLDKEAVFIGSLTHVEIWSKERWTANSAYEDVDAVTDRLAAMGITI